MKINKGLHDDQPEPHEQLPVILCIDVRRSRSRVHVAFLENVLDIQPRQQSRIHAKSDRSSKSLAMVIKCACQGVRVSRLDCLDVMRHVLIFRNRVFRR